MAADAKTQEDVLTTILQDFLVRCARNDATIDEVSSVVSVFCLLCKLRKINPIVDQVLVNTEDLTIEDVKATLK